ncbi:MAG: twin-arginine translocase subunit TatC [Candidatus Omnitrophica bacterium]|nr:twin-arginine translocase subunit TatC [Candidatus Omnitrophota bacterium]
MKKNSNPEKELPVIEHLRELRRRLIICLVSLGIFSIIGLSFAGSLLEFLKFPARDLIPKLVFLSPQEGLLVYIRVSFIFAFILSLPVILYQVWAFILPALEEKLKRYTLRFILAGILAFILGGAFGYFILVPPALKFLLSFAKEQFQPLISAQSYISFVSSLIFLSGLVFELPVLSVILARLGLLTHKFLRKNFKFAVVLIFILCAIVTPTVDAFNLLILAGPVLLLYEVSIWLCRIFERK